MIVGSDSADFLDDLLDDLYGRLEVLIELQLGVLNEGTRGMLGDDAANGGPEYSFEYFIRQEVRGAPVIANTSNKGIKLNVDTNYSVVCSFLEWGINDPSIVNVFSKYF